MNPRISRSVHGGRRYPRRRLNVRLLCVTLIASAVVLPLGFLWHRYQVRKTANSHLQRADQYEREGRTQDAIHHLHQYLMMESDDIDSRARMVSLYTDDIGSPRERAHAISLLYQIVGVVPDRDDLRLKLAEQLLLAGEFAAAEVEAERLLSSATRETDRAGAQKVLGLSRFARVRHRGPEFVRQTAQALDKAFRAAPEDVEVAMAAATLYRAYADELADLVESPVSHADQIMEDMVAARDHDADAVVANHRYRTRYGMATDSTHLREAVAADPNHIEASLLLAAECERRGTPDALAEAITVLRNAIDAAPSDLRGYSALGRLYAASGKLEEAHRLLKQAREKAGQEDVSLMLAMADLSIRRGLVDDAEKQLEQIEPLLQTSGARSPVRQIAMEREFQVVKASLLLARNRQQEAMKLLVPLTEGSISQSGDEVRPHPRGTLLLAQLAFDRGEWDLAAKYWEAVTESDPEQAIAHHFAGLSLLNAGRAGQAIGKLEQARHTGIPPATIAPDLVRAHLAAQLALPAEHRDWSVFRNELSAAKAEGTKACRLMVAEIEYLRATAPDGWREAARKLLDDARPSLLDDPEMRRRLPLLYLAVGSTEAAADALRAAGEREESAVGRALLRSAFHAEQGDPAAADAELVQGIAEAASPGRHLLQVERARLAAESGNWQFAYELARELVDGSQDDVQVLTLAAEIALASGHHEAAAQWEQQLRMVEGETGTHWRYLRAARWLNDYQRLTEEEKGELGALIDAMRQLRPSWYRALLLAGRYEELQGNARIALSSYRRALELGGARVPTLLRLISVLTTVGEYQEAEQYARVLRAGGLGHGQRELSAQVHPLAALVLHAQLLHRQGRANEVVKIVNQFVEARGTPDDETTRAELFSQIALLYESLEMHAAAEPWLRKRDPLVPHGFALLARNLAAQGRVDEALRLCTERAEGPLRPHAARAAAEILASNSGEDTVENPQARALIRETVDEHSQDVPLLLSAANYFVSVNETEQAIGAFRRVVELEPNHIVALNNLATLLGDQEETRDEALIYIDRAIEEAGRLPALLDTLGTIYLRAGDFERAGSHLEEAVAKGGSDPRYLFHLAAALHKLGRQDDADRSLELALERGIGEKLLTESDRQLLSDLQGKSNVAGAR